MKSQKIEHPRRYFQLKAITNDEAEDEKQIIISQKGNNGIGIIDFFEGKNIFVTGGTGFLAKGTLNNIYSVILLRREF